MKRFQSFKYELQPNGKQIRSMCCFAGSCRFVFNKALALQEENHKTGGKFINYVTMAKYLTVWRNGIETPWLKDAPCGPLQHALMNLEKAYKNFFNKKADLPRFKKKGQYDNFRYPDPKQFKIDQGNSRIFMPKLGWLRYRNSRNIVGVPKNITVSNHGNKWFISIQTECEIEQPVHPTTSIVGIDVGIIHFATLSDGSYIEPLNTFRMYQQKLVYYQRAMSNKTKFSNNWKKAKARVQKVHTHIANMRRDFLHKTTTTISKNHAIVCIEDLQIRNMSKSAAGSSKTPGHNIKVKSNLNKSILDQGWFEFRRQLEYKQAWLGGKVLAVPPQNTSRTCPNPACGHVSAKNRRSQARFVCVKCGYENNADIVGALNILAAGHAVLACGGTAQLNCPMKQEPAEATIQKFICV
jgi:putative transposase